MFLCKNATKCLQYIFHYPSKIMFDDDDAEVVGLILVGGVSIFVFCFIFKEVKN